LRLDAGTRALDAGRRDAETPAVPASQRYPTASATLSAVLDDAADSGTGVMGTATWSGTVEGVDLEVTLTGCAGEGAYPLAILQGDCSPESLRGALWAGKRGDGLPALQCTGTGAGIAGASYERPALREDAWTIGDHAASDIVGHALAVRDGAGTIVACGAIVQRADLERRPLPPGDQPPKLDSRAAVGGMCLARQAPGNSPKCPDSAALLECEALHCDIAGCLETCATYASCLDQQTDACLITGPCQLTAECVACQGDMQACGMSFCGEHMFCGAAPTPDGPCQRMAGCCALQGSESATCSGLLLPFLAGLGGDANCLGSMQDWDVVAHLHVPCTFGSGEPSTNSEPAQPTNPAAQLADDRAGAACTSDADCPGGNCAIAAATGDGYCTRACEAAAECGRAGRCSGGQAVSSKQCLATCQEHADCREGFVCTGKLEGARISLPGVCSPKRRVDQLADNVAGRACEDDAACGGGKCAQTSLLGTSYPGNYCTARCYEDAQCGQGGVCLRTHHSSDPGYCLQSCAADADCTREDYGCWELGDGERTLHACYPLQRALPDDRAGEPCSADADCGGPHAFCAKELPYDGLVTNELQPAAGGYCTQRCALDRECGAGAQCINYGSSGGLCLASCSNTAPCRNDYVCFPHSRDNDETAAVCVTPGP
jgi:hypothetical protein